MHDEVILSSLSYKMEEELKHLLTGQPCPPIKGSSLPLGKNRGKSVK